MTNPKVWLIGLNEEEKALLEETIAKTKVKTNYIIFDNVREVMERLEKIEVSNDYNAQKPDLIVFTTRLEYLEQEKIRNKCGKKYAWIQIHDTQSQFVNLSLKLNRLKD
jgi:hypothetical protein